MTATFDKDEYGSIIVFSDDTRFRINVDQIPVGIAGPSRRIPIKWHSNFETITADTIKSNCVVIIDASYSDSISTEFDRALDSIAKTRPTNQKCSLSIWVLYGGDAKWSNIVNTSNDFRVDMLLPKLSLEEILLAAVCHLRQINMITSPFEHMRNSRAIGRRISIGAWEFKQNTQTVLLPNGGECSLSDLEWQYLMYLAQRDIQKSRVDPSVEKFINSIKRKDALVFRIKKKLGAEFPIRTDSSGGYHLIA